MASSVNNIAATFSKVAKPSSSSSSSSSSHQKNLPFSVSVTSWNPHATLPKSQRSSLVNFYGPPGPPPTIKLISTVHPPCRPMMTMVDVGKKVPDNITLSYLNRHDVVQTVNLSSLCKGRKVAVVGVSAAFSPGCTWFVKSVVELARAKGADLIACVAVNDVFVMRAWGENLALGDDHNRVMMLSDGRGELAGAFAVRSRRFCVNTVNAVITGVDFDEEN